MVKTAQTPPARTSRRWAVWILFIAACLGLVAAKLAADTQRKRQRLAWEMALAVHGLNTELARRSLHEQLELARGQSLETLRRRWDLDRHPTVVSEGITRVVAPSEAINRDVSGFRVTLHFEDTGFTDFTLSPPRLPPRPAFTLWRFFNAALLALTLAAAGAWLTLILAIAFNRSRAARFAEAALGAALLAMLCFALWRFGLYGPISGATTYTGLAVAAVMVVASVVLLARAVRRRRREDESRCAHCLYDLTGNESGVCPECGTPTPAALRREQAERAQRYARAVQQGSIVTP